MDSIEHRFSENETFRIPRGLSYCNRGLGYGETSVPVLIEEIVIMCSVLFSIFLPIDPSK